MPKKQPPSEKILITGLTREGKTFRPSDWAERMSGKLATFQNRRIKYSPLLQPSTSKEGYKCVMLDPELKKTNPELYDSILQFAQMNNLQICEHNEDVDDNSNS